MKRTVLLVVGLIAVLFSIVIAAVPQLINFQGILRDGSGNPVANGSYSVTFTIYDAPAGGNNLWSETQSVSTNGGLFTILLGSSTPVLDSTFNDSSRYLGIKVGADPEMTPRQRMSSVGYSHNSSEWTSAGADLFRLNGNVGIGTASPSPSTKLNVVTSVGTGVFGQSGDHIGVHGVSVSSSPFTITGCLGTASNNSSGTAQGGYFYGFSSTGTGYGVYGDGTTYGVVGLGGNRGVTGIGTTYGVYGVSNIGGGAGVFGDRGANPATWAGDFLGDVRISEDLVVAGSVVKGGGGFKIDHPTDAANKYLYHSFVESPDMKNIYDGVITTDAKGKVTVTLPHWFGAVNKDFRYQLTVIGEFAQAIISKKIEGNQFSIKTDKPNIEVSWQVTGIRKDAYAEAHRIPVEEIKSGKERGKYIHPKEHGVSEALGIQYEMTQKLKAERRQQEEQQAKMEAEQKQMEEQRAKMEQERLIQQ